MTTIAYDGTTLVVDSQVTSGNLVFGKVDKIVKLNDGRYLTGTGDIGLLTVVKDWLNGGEKPVLTETDNFIGLLIEPNGSCFEITTKLDIWETCVPWTGGSGEVIAMTALHCGKSPKEAVALACKLDVNSGLPLKVVTIKKEKKNGRK